MRFGVPPEGVSKEDFVKAVIDSLPKGALEVDVLSTSPNGDATDVVFRVRSTDKSSKAVADALNSPIFREKQCSS